MEKRLLFESDCENNVVLSCYTNDHDELYVEMYNEEQREYSFYMTLTKDLIKHLDSCLKEME